VTNLSKTCLALCGLIALAMAVASPPCAVAEELPYSVGLGFEFASGSYGTGTRTESVYAPVTAAFYPNERIGFSVEIPFLYQSNGNVNTSVYSGPQGGKTMMMPAGNAMGNMGGSPGTGTGALSPANGQQSPYGLGDITLKAGYLLVVEGPVMPQVRPSLFVKFPTADSGKALGTGEFDGGLALELSRWLDKWNAFAEAGYTVQGKSARLPLRNYLTYNAGAAYQLTESFRPILYIKGATPPADNSSALLEVRLKLKYQATRHTGMEGYLAKGVTSNSPEYGSGLAVFYDF